MLPASLIKKRISYKLGGVEAQYDVSQSLFSSFDIDKGTHALINSLRKNPLLDYSKILDLGCGYGAIGVFLAKQDPQSEVHLTDRDLLAVEFARHNAALNNVKLHVYPSLDYQAIEAKFSLILCNFPAKMEKAGLEAFVHKASNYLLDDGVLALVVVRELKEELNEVLLHEAISQRYCEHRRDYCIYHLAFHKDLASTEDPYSRGQLEHPLGTSYTIRTARGMPEFDTLSYGSEVLFSLLTEMTSYKSVLLLEPGQGFAAVALWDILKPDNICLASRDLLSLDYTGMNLEQNGCTNLRRQPCAYLEECPREDLVVVNLCVKKPDELHIHNLDFLMACNKDMVIYGKAAFVKKFVAQRNISLKKTLDLKGYSAIWIKK